MNDFQWLMKEWTHLAPYNAAHVLKVSGPAQVERWNEALRRVAAGLEVPIGEAELGDLDFEDAIAQELNRAFAPGAAPLRATVVGARSADHFLVICYDHWFADSASVREFMRRLFFSYRGEAESLPVLQPAIPAGSSPVQLKTLLAAWRNYRSHAGATRIHLRDRFDFKAGFLARDFPPGSSELLRARARALDATVNDVFLGAAAQVLGARSAVKGPARRAGIFHPRRERLAVGSAVDVRSTSADPSVFGFEIGYYAVVLDAPERMEWEELIRAIARRTKILKAKEEIERFNESLKIARRIWPWFRDPRRAAQMFHKNIPLAAAISNVNLSASWVETAMRLREGPRLLGYRRISPTGPLVPLVFTLTTAAEQLSLCLTHRISAFSRPAAKRLLESFMAKLQENSCGRL